MGLLPLRILLVEDSEDDAELILRQLRRSGYEPLARRVASAEEMEPALKDSTWDIVISDYVMPGFGGLEALQIFHQRSLDIPFIIVSGHIGEEIAVSAMKAGADDYLMKDRLGRLVPAVNRALEDAEIRRAHKRANQALRESEERFRQLAENIGAVFFMFEGINADSVGKVSYVSPAFQKVWGLPAESLTSTPDLWLKAIHPEDRARVIDKIRQISEVSLSDEFRVLHLDLNVRWVHLRTFPIRNEQGAAYRVAALAEDVTERKRAEELLAANAEQLRNNVEELTAIQEELRQSNDELSQARNGLERRVQERTADLARANMELKEQMEERRRLENELLEIAENERRRIGFDLHDDLGQKMMGVSLLLKALETNLAHKHAREASETRKIQQLVHQVINHTHNLAHCFSALDINGADVSHQLKTLAENVSKTFQISCSFRATGSVPEVPSETAQQLCKIAEESISNAIKHGKASRVTILLVPREKDIVLRIKNDGVPFPEQAEPSNRLGLRIMNYRAHLIGGALEICANRNSGTLVMCTVPLPTRRAARADKQPVVPNQVASRRNGSHVQSVSLAAAAPSPGT
jgi:PAS domain S-box-containing protein